MPDTQQENAKNLKNLGLKATGPRLKILEIFQERAKAGEVRHLSAEEVYKELVNVGRISHGLPRLGPVCFCRDSDTQKF